MPATTAPMTEPRRAASGFDVVLSVVIVLMIALAAGAVWAMIALWFGRPFAVLALPLGAIVGVAMRSAGFGGWLGALGAAALTLVASAYAQGLIASTMVALAMGFYLLDSLSRIGPEMACAVAWARASTIDLAIFGSAALIAAVLAGRRGR